MTNYIIEDSGRGEREYNIYSRLLKDRIVSLIGEINDDIAGVICSQLLFLDSKSNEPITFFINSMGGVVTAGLAIYDIMKYIDSPVYTVCSGQACSMGSFLLTAGDKRFSLPNSTLMYHSISSGFSGSIHDHEKHYLECVRLQNLLTDMLFERSKNIDRKEFDTQFSRDWFLSPQKALEYGFIDCVIQKSGDISRYIENN